MLELSFIIFTFISCETALINMIGMLGWSSFSLDSTMTPVLTSHRAPWR